MMRIVAAFFLIAGFIPLQCLAQQDSAFMVTPDKWEKKYLLKGAVPLPHQDILRKLDWSWECLGPNELPEELNPGGRAIPAFARDRGNGTGRINYLYLHPKYSNHLWACSPTGGVWHTSDSGEQWHSAGTDRLEISGVSSITVDPFNTSRWVIATGDGDDVFAWSDGVWITHDNGTSYSRINGSFEGQRLPFGQPGDMEGRISDLASDPRKFKKLIAATNRGLWVSQGPLKSSSVRWSRRADGDFYDIVYISGKKKRRDIIAAAGEKLVISFNGGRTWQVMPDPEFRQTDRFPFKRISIEYSPDDPDKIYAAVTCSAAASQSAIGEGTLQVFDLKERKWTFIRSLKEDMNNVIPTRARAFAISPVDRNIMMCGNIQPLYRSVDGGINFSRIEKNQMHDDCHDIDFSVDGTVVWAAHDGGVSRSVDGGLHFDPRDKGIGAANVFGLSVAQTSEPHVVMGGYDTGGNVLRNGKWWHASWGDGFETIIHPFDPDIVFTTAQNGSIYRATSGVDFDTPVAPSGSKTEWHTWIRMHPVNYDMVFCSGVRLMRSLNLGDSWSSIFNAPEMDSSLLNVYRFFLSADHPGVMYLYVLDNTLIQPQIWRTFNVTEPNPAAIKWERLPAVPVEGWISSIVADPRDPAKCWMLYNRTESDGKVWYWNGSEWQDQTGNMGLARGESMILQKGPERRLYVGTTYGVFTRKAEESQWTLLSGLPGTPIKSLDINYTAGKLVVGTFGRGVWWGDLFR